MPQFLPFFIILFVGLFFSEVFYRLHLPWVIALIIGGIVAGPYGLELFEPDATMQLIGEIGLIFLMFMAGLEIKFSTLKEIGPGVIKMTFFNGIMPFFIGMGLGFFFGYGLAPAALIGVMFMSSSIAVVIPSLEANDLMSGNVGKTIVASTVVADILSLVLLSFFLQAQSSTTSLPFPVFYALLLLTLAAMRWLIPKIRWFVFSRSPKGVNLFEWEFQLIFVILLGTVVIFSLLGLHAIIAGFFTGMVLSESIKSDVLKGKLRAISYGFFIPVFFVLVGADTNIRIFAEIGPEIAVLTVVIVLASMASKFTGGWIGGRLSNFTNKESSLIGIATIPQLSGTLAVAVAGFQFGILDEKLVTVMVILSIVTTFVGPVLLHYVKNRHEKGVDSELELSKA